MSQLITELQSLPPKRIVIAYPTSKNGIRQADTLSRQLNQLGADTYRAFLPDKPSRRTTKGMGDAIRQATWLGKGTDPAVSVKDTQTDVVDEVSPDNADSEEISQPAELIQKTPETDTEASETVEVLPATVSPPAPEDIPAEVSEQEVVFNFDGRRYRVRGLDNNPCHNQLKVNVLVSRGELLHVDTLDLYASRPRAAFIRHAALELRVKEELVKHDLGKIFLKLEALQNEIIQKTLTPKTKAISLTPSQRAQATGLLTAPNLLERIVEDFNFCGVVGETTNSLVAYLAGLSRKLDNPLAVIIQSTSAAGKSALMNNVMAFIPPEDRLQYSALSGQSLFYMANEDMRHKVLSISEEEGASKATYALKLLQSEGKLTIASTGKDPNSGRHVAHRYHVEGPVMLFTSTTAIDIDEELLNRCLVLTIDEDRAQTQAIHQQQRYSETLEGLIADQQRDDIITLHRNAQRLIRPLKVVNPYAPQLTFLDDKTRTRRDHVKYLTLIRTIALLHQYQREVKTTFVKGTPVEYIEVTREDITIANRLAHDVFGRTLDDVPPQTRRLLQMIDAMVKQRCEEKHLSQREVRFTRHDIQAYTAWGTTQLKVHLKRLEAEEYLLIHRGGRGQRIVYELLYNSEGEDGNAFLMGLIDAETLEAPTYDPTRSGETASKSGPGRVQVGGQSGTCLTMNSSDIGKQINTVAEPPTVSADNCTLEVHTSEESYRTVKCAHEKVPHV